MESRYPEAHAYLQTAMQLFTGGGGSIMGVEGAKLKGFLLACEGVLGTRGRGGRKDESLTSKLSRLVQAKDYEVCKSAKRRWSLEAFVPLLLFREWYYC